MSYNYEHVQGVVLKHVTHTVAKSYISTGPGLLPTPYEEKKSCFLHPFVFF